MAFTIFQAGSTLYGMDQRGSTVALTLPTGVVLDATLAARFAVFGNYAILVNSPNRPLAIDANLNVRVLCPNPPSGPLTLTGVAGGSLSGDFKARQTYIVRDMNGAVIAESDFGPLMGTATVVASKYLQASAINSSADTVSASRLYRTSSGTAVYFKWMDVDGNTQTSSTLDDLSDAGLATFSSPSLGTPPDLALIAEFRSRLFGVAKADLNRIYYTEVGTSYAWPSINVITVPRLGSDARGATGFARRRDALGGGRTNGFYQITGTSISDFRMVNISENCGIEAPDSVKVYRDTAFFLWKDGVYQWDNAGLKNVSAGKVSRWFTRNGTFNLSRLQYAFAEIDALRKKYRLFLASASSTIENCWIEYDFEEEKWWGPHTSHAFNPSAAFTFSTDSGLRVPMVGATDGFCRLDRLRRTDDDTVGIDFDLVTARQHSVVDSRGDRVGLPDEEKYFGELSISMQPQPRGVLTVQATAGDLDASRSGDPEDAYLAPLTSDRECLGRVGQGKAYKLRFRNNVAGQHVNLRGYEISPSFVVGRR